MKRPKLSLILAAAAIPLAVVTSDSSAVALRVAPVILDATPRHDPTDRRSNDFLRVTFSPDGDLRNDSVVIRVRSHRGERLVLNVRAISSSAEVGTYEQRARSTISSFVW